MSELALIPSRRTVWWCDVAAAVVTALFVTLGVLAGVQLTQLSEVHRAFLEAANALDLTARAVALVGEVTLIGDEASGLADSVRATATELHTSATSIRDDLQALALLIGIAIAAIPVVPLALLYAPLRLARHRELQRLRTLLAGSAEPALVEQLALAAVQRIPYRELRRVSERPLLDLHHGRHLHLAAAELCRLGIRPPPGWIGPPHG